ncbi:MAG: prephenate dehydrogenase/arogenate dehydrogenase family protein [Acidobacteria bacterium]|nr:prephenate dehydrogenase/arogenate dehydrogenase family protein [Acidobacteriota bacterium]
MASPRVAVIGDGLIGRSVRLAWERAVTDARVVSLEAGDDPSLVSSADIIILATPVAAILEWLPRLPALAADAQLIMDTGSTKRAISDVARAVSLPRFVPGHPMAGGATSGPAHARADLFDRRPWLLVDATVPAALHDEATAFVTTLGATAVWLPDATTHDTIVAAVSHLPQVVSSVLRSTIIDAVGEEGVRLAGAGYRDTTRLAASAATLWAPILATNADAIAPLLRQVARELDAAADSLTDHAAVDALFTRAQRHLPDP